MAKSRGFISFDYDNDAALKDFLIGQAKNEDSPFEIADYSIKEHLSGDWEKKAEAKINQVDFVCVICGEKTDTAKGVSAELTIARKNNISYFLLAGYKDKTCKLPIAAAKDDKLYSWTWDNLKALINGAR